MTRRAAALACLLVAACREEPRRPPADVAERAAPPGSAGPPSPAVAPCTTAGPGAGAPAAGVRPAFAVQVAALADSAGATRLRDSLAHAGWVAYVRDGGGGARWRVRVAASADVGVARRVAAGLAAAGRAAVVVRDSTGEPGAAARLHAVGGSPGMSSRVRWALSPDRCALLAVHDPAAVENEPVPNAFLYASERSGAAFGHERVWDVAVSPDWRRLAYGRAWVLQGRERDSLTTAEWEGVARETGTTAAAARAAAFPASGMAVAFGLAQPVVVDLAADPRGADRRVLRTLVGWRVRWAGEGALALGRAPVSALDDAPPAGWTLVDAATGAPRGGAAPADSGTPGVSWEAGPTVDIGVPVDVRPDTIAIAPGRVTSGGGWVSVARPPRAGAPADAARIVGPGTALAATAGGRFILALAPKIRPKEYDAPMELVVYEVAP